jgi:hypothetical protein
VYYIGMAQPKEPPLSIRLSPEVLAKVDRYAYASECSRHAALVRLICTGLDGKAGWQAAYEAEVAAVQEPAPMKRQAVPYGSRLKKR